jgi:hypothetical protein
MGDGLWALGFGKTAAFDGGQKKKDRLTNQPILS